MTKVTLTESGTPVRLVESLATQFSEGDVVDTPDGLGIVSGIRTEPFEGADGEDIEATEDSPTYVVAVEDEDKTVGFYSASELTSDELPEVDVDSPTESLQVLMDIDSATEALQDGFFEYPESWQESEQPARLIALKAWAGMGGRHGGGGTPSGCVREMTGEVASPNRFCADFKDRILGWEGWRQGGD